MPFTLLDYQERSGVANSEVQTTPAGARGLYLFVKTRADQFVKLVLVAVMPDGESVELAIADPVNEGTPRGITSDGGHKPVAFVPDAGPWALGNYYVHPIFIYTVPGLPDQWLIQVQPDEGCVESWEAEVLGSYIY